MTIDNQPCVVYTLKVNKGGKFSMAKVKKEIGGKKSIFKRVLLFAALGMAIGAVVAAVIFRVSNMPAFNLLEIGVASIGAGAAVGVGVGTATAGEAIKVNHTKNKVIESMEKIKKLDKDKSSIVSVKERKNICKKYG